MFTEGVSTDLSQMFLQVGDRCAKLAREAPERDPAADLLRQLEAVARAEAENVEKPFRLGVVGMFKSGKSSVLNTFLRRKVLQEGRTETTSVLTELRFAETADDERGVIEFHGGRAEQRSVEEALTYTDVRSDVFRDLREDDKRKQQESIRQITLHLHCDLLRTLHLLDTPGFGGSAVGDRKAFDSLKEVDAALMVFSADRVGTQDEMEVADALSRAKRPIVALLNKVDDGQGEMLGESRLEEPEAFLRDHFKTLVRGADGQPLIFRYSALEVWKALEVLEDPAVSRDAGAKALRGLERWGFRGHGDGERERGVIEFLRTRYFASDREAHRRKVEQARGYVTGAVAACLNDLDQQLAQVAEQLSTVEGQRSEVEEQQQRQLDAKIDKIEVEIRSVIDDRLEPFSMRLEEALKQLIESRSEFDLLDIIKMTRTNDRLAEQVKEEFEEEFPEWEVDNFSDDVRRRLHRLMKREWKLVIKDLREINPSVELPDVGDLLEHVNQAIRDFSLALYGYIAADIALLFVPGGQIIAIFQLLALGAGLYSSKKHTKAVKKAQRQSRSQIRKLTEKIRNQLAQQALDLNDELATQARSVLWAQVEDLGQEVTQILETQSRWRAARRDLAHDLEMLERVSEDQAEESRVS